MAGCFFSLIIEAYIQEIKSKETLLTLAMNTKIRHKTRPKGSTKGTEKQDWWYKKNGFNIRKECEKSFQEPFITSWHEYFLNLGRLIKSSHLS